MQDRLLMVQIRTLEHLELFIVTTLDLVHLQDINALRRSISSFESALESDRMEFNARYSPGIPNL